MFGNGDGFDRFIDREQERHGKRSTRDHDKSDALKRAGLHDARDRAARRHRRERIARASLPFVGLAVALFAVIVWAPWTPRTSPPENVEHFALAPLPSVGVLAEAIERDVDRYLEWKADNTLPAVTRDAAPLGDDEPSDDTARLELLAMAIRLYPAHVPESTWGPALVDVLVDSDHERLRTEAAGMLALLGHVGAADAIFDAFVDARETGGDVVPQLRALRDIVPRLVDLPPWIGQLETELLLLIEDDNLGVGGVAALSLTELARRVHRDWCNEATRCFDRYPIQSILLASVSVSHNPRAALAIIAKGIAHRDGSVRHSAVAAIPAARLRYDSFAELDRIKQMLLALALNKGEARAIRRTAINSLVAMRAQREIDIVLTLGEEWIAILANSSNLGGSEPGELPEVRDLASAPPTLPAEDRVRIRTAAKRFFRQMSDTEAFQHDLINERRGSSLGDPMRRVLGGFPEETLSRPR